MCRLLKSILPLFMFIVNVLSAEWLLPEHPFSETAQNHKVAVDARGHAIAVWEDIDHNAHHVILGSNFNAETMLWSPSFKVSDSSGSDDDAPMVAMSHYGTGVVVFRDNNIPSIQARVFKSGSWSMVEAFLDEGLLSKPMLAINNTGHAIIVWISSVHGLQSVVCENGVLREHVRIDPSMTDINTEVRLIINDQGKAAIFWMDKHSIRYRIWQESTWSPVKKANSNQGNKAFDVGMDAAGDLLLVFQRDNTINFKKYSEGKWFPKVTISGEKSLNESPKILVDPKGTALVIWKKNGLILESSYYDKNDWKRHTAADLTGSEEIEIVNDSHESTLVIFTSQDSGLYTLKSIVFHHKLGWSPSQVILSSSVAFKNLAVGVSSLYHTAFALWQTDHKTVGSLSLLVMPTLAPTVFEVRLKKDRFPSQTDRIHILKWNQSIDPTVVAYRIKQGNKVIFECPVNGVHELILHNRKGKDVETYSICSLNVLGVEGAPKTIAIR